MLRLLIDMVKDKFPYYWSQPDGNGVHHETHSRPTDHELAQLIAITFNCNCTELDVFMARGKHKRRAKALKRVGNTEDLLEMINYYAVDEEDFIQPRRQITKNFHNHLERIT